MGTATVTKSWAGAIEVLQSQAASIRATLHRNVDDLTHAESLHSPQPGGNCLNWVIGHLDQVNEQMLGLLGQSAVLGATALARYQRGTPELQDAGEALPLEKLMSVWDEQWARIDKGLAELTAEKLETPVPHSPRGKADETVGSLLATLLFHQAYHAGQTGLLRRIAGHEGAIR
ncbi:MAG TPA: DinB family protein [Acidobacteriaceae bacterium]|nr:DinB family protein [Acidobacteriaceae bacterium]